MKHRTLVELLAHGAGLAAAKTAVWSADARMSYDELTDGARRIATFLSDAGVKRGDRVALWMDKTPACVQTIVGVLYAGAAYVPLDPRAPWRRCRAILDDCDVAALVVDAPRLPMMAELLDGLHLPLLLVDATAFDAQTSATRTVTRAQALGCTARELSPPAAEDLAYILYTSGSTGIPKGVVHTHRSGVAFTDWVIDTYHVRSDDVFSSHAPFHFDLSILDLYASLGTGASVRLISSVEAMLPPHLVKGVAEWGITVWYSVPSILSAMLEVGELEKRGFGRVHTLLFAGEVFPTPQLRRLRAALPDVRLSNLFGPTETNVCTYYDVPREIPPGRAIPIGRACEHLDTFVLDANGNEVGVGTEGTLWVKGGNLMSGYWSRSGLKGLAPDPRGRPGMVYCTGDQVRLQPDGNYDFLGRRDHMIKVRGFRVETGEIESVLAAHPAVVEAIVVPIPDERAGNRIVSTVVMRAGETMDAGALSAFCKERLPAYMIPEHFDIVASLPRTSTGKADRKMLLEEWQKRNLA
jgi:amino acid adenylation domain-containing protein